MHDRQAQIGFFYLDGTKMPLIRDDYAPMDIEELPPFFENMKKDEMYDSIMPKKTEVRETVKIEK